MPMISATMPQPLRRVAGELLSRLQDGHLGGVVRGAAFVMAIRVAGAAIALLSQVMLARWMGAFEYGIFSYVWVWVIVLGLVVPMGFGTSVLRFIPEYRTKQRWARLRGFIGASSGVVLAVSCAASAAGLVLLYAMRGHIDSIYVLPLAIGLLCVPAFAMTDYQEGAARAFGWVNLAYIPAYIVRPLLIAGAAGGIFHFTGGATGLQVALGALAACVVTVAVQRLLLQYRMAREVPSARPAWHTKYWIAASAPLVLVEGLYMLMTNTDIVLLGYFADPDDVGIYFAATRIANLMAFIFFSLNALAVPKFAELHGAGKHDELQRFMRGVIHAMFWPTLAAGIFLLAAGEFILGLFGAGFEAGYVLLALLMLGFLVRAATGPTEYLLNMTGNQNVVALVYGLAAAGNIVLNLLLIPEFGAAGAALATAISVFVSTVFLAVAVKRRLGITAFIFTANRARARGAA
ncbi:MAG: polysaccharide biosynthesis C-terminal domain-containing protein [Parvibaculum sp.]|jgi:O-antigen/teichoic acid export membrane protein